MTKTPNVHIFKNETISLTQCHDGFWLYDATLGMNLAIRAKDSQSAFIAAIEYYQKRLIQIETEFKTLSDKVNSFVQSFDLDHDE